MDNRRVKLWCLTEGGFLSRNPQTFVVCYYYTTPLLLEEKLINRGISIN